MSKKNRNQQNTVAQNDNTLGATGGAEVSQDASADLEQEVNIEFGKDFADDDVTELDTANDGIVVSEDRVGIVELDSNLKPVGGVLVQTVLVNRIETAEEARDYINENYDVPQDTKVVYVTEDRNVFWKENQSDAINHSQNHKLKLFTLEWD